MQTNNHLDQDVSSDLALTDRHNLGLFQKAMVPPFVTTNTFLELSLQLCVHGRCADLLEVFPVTLCECLVHSNISFFGLSQETSCKTEILELPAHTQRTISKGRTVRGLVGSPEQNQSLNCTMSSLSMFFTWQQSFQCYAYGAWRT